MRTCSENRNNPFVGFVDVRAVRNITKTIIVVRETPVEELFVLPDLGLLTVQGTIGGPIRPWIHRSRWAAVCRPPVVAGAKDDGSLHGSTRP